jgi:predicted RNA-binding protein YlxR (DUF448 family)
MSRRSHVPIRSCSGCGERAPQRELVRFVAAGAGLCLDGARRRPGRGAYLHRRDSCYAAFVARKPPLRSLRRSVDRTLRAALVEQLRQDVR